MTSTSQDPASVESAVHHELGVGCVRPPTPANAGFEAYTWLLDLEHPVDGHDKVALRLYASLKREGAQAREAAVLAHVANSECPAPRALAHGPSSSAFGVPWLLMSKVLGTPTRSMVTLARAAAAVHGVALDGWAIPPPRPPRGDTDAVLAGHPQLRDAAARLAQLPPPTAQVAPCLVHGDFGTPNVLEDPSGAFTVIDWGSAQPGDAHQDLGRVAAAVRTAGQPNAENAFLDAYPMPIDRQRLRLWTAIGLLQLWAFAVASTTPGLVEQAGVKPEMLGRAPDAGHVERLFWEAVLET